MSDFVYFSIEEIPLKRSAALDKFSRPPNGFYPDSMIKYDEHSILHETLATSTRTQKESLLDGNNHEKHGMGSNATLRSATYLCISQLSILRFSKYRNGRAA